MEITAEIKAKVMAQYIGQKVLFYEGETLELIGVSQQFLVGYQPPMGEVEGDEIEVNIKDALLSLTHLSSITDEHANLVGQLGCTTGAWLREQINKNMIWKLQPDMYQLLQFLGYDLPHYLLNGQTLKEAGIAIYKTT